MIEPKKIHSFARHEILPTLVDRYETRSFSRELWRKMADAGLFGLMVPAEFGGSGAGPRLLLEAVDAFVTGGCDLGLCLSWLDHLLIHTHVIQRFGNETQKQRHIPPLVAGERIGALAASEPETGADPVRMQASADWSNGSYTIHAHKLFITNGPVADFVIVLARTGPAPGKDGISALLVETAAPGFRVMQEMDFGFLNTSPHGELVFENCSVPETNLLGTVGQGHQRISRAVFGCERYVLLYALGALFRALLDRLIEGFRTTGPPPAYLAKRIAASHVNLEGLREATGRWAEEALSRDRLDSRLMQRLLFSGQAFHRCWREIQKISEQASLPDDPVFRILLKDARLLEINGKLFALQMERTARILFGG